MIKYKGETKVEEQKISFWKRIIISIKNIEQYQILAGESTKSAIKYLLKLMVLFRNTPFYLGKKGKNLNALY